MRYNCLLENVNPVFIVRVKPSVHKDIPITRNYKEIEGDSRGAKVQAGARGMAEPGHRQTCSHLGGRNSDAQKFRISEHRRTLTDSRPGGMAASCSHQNKPGSRELYSDVGLRNGRKTIHFREYSSCSKSGFVGK